MDTFIHYPAESTKEGHVDRILAWGMKGDKQNMKWQQTKWKERNERKGKEWKESKSKEMKGKQRKGNERKRKPAASKQAWSNTNTEKSLVSADPLHAQL